jgi:hypothetical protein
MPQLRPHLHSRASFRPIAFGILAFLAVRSLREDPARRWGRQ